ncbi:MAG: glycosyltransferase family 4 protein, partial [Trueperaceae bacterium]|nr:glycosyltransferase family 4 protein [Trueperaceae bacterium]
MRHDANSRPNRDATVRVWLVGDFAASRAGNFSVAEDLARRLAERGYSVGTTSDRRQRVARVVDMAIRTWRRSRFVDVAAVDVYSGRAFVWAKVVVGVLRRQRVPTVLVLRGGNLPQMAQRAPDRMRRLLGQGAAVVALSPYLGDRLAPFTRSMRVIPNPIDVSLYTYRQRVTAAPRLVWLRTFEELYNPVMAVEVLARVAQRYPDASLVMVGKDVGDGTLERARRTAVDLGVAGRVEFVGPVAKSDVPVQLQRGDVLVNTPRIDNVPVSVLEAMATGLCIVSTDVGGIPNLLTDGQDALLVPDANPEAMAAAVVRCCADPALAARLSAAARRTALGFDWSAVLPQWEALLNEVAAGGRA